MKDNSKPSGNVTMPEYATIDQALATLIDRAQATGHPVMASFVIRDGLMGILTVGSLLEVSNLSRIIMAIGSSPLVKMGER